MIPEGRSPKGIVGLVTLTSSTLASSVEEAVASENQDPLRPFKGKEARLCLTSTSIFQLKDWGGEGTKNAVNTAVRPNERQQSDREAE
jgi:hypothetical protein